MQLRELAELASDRVSERAYGPLFTPKFTLNPTTSKRTASKKHGMKMFQSTNFMTFKFEFLSFKFVNSPTTQIPRIHHALMITSLLHSATQKINIAKARNRGGKGDHMNRSDLENNRNSARKQESEERRENEGICAQRYEH